jgi:hypothetical protein
MPPVHPEARNGREVEAMAALCSEVQLECHRSSGKAFIKAMKTWYKFSEWKSTNNNRNIGNNNNNYNNNSNSNSNSMGLIGRRKPKKKLAALASAAAASVLVSVTVVATPQIEKKE